MAEVLEVTARKFRENLRYFFDIADKGQQLVIKRGRKQSYVLTPIQDDDLVLSPKALKRIDESLEQIKQGRSVKY